MDAAFQGAQVGVWLKDARAAARKAQDIGQRRAAGLPVESSAGAMTRARRDQLEEIDPSWCPVWPVTWQRCIHLVRQHLDTGQALPTMAGEVVRQAEGLGLWVTSVRHGRDQLTGVQQWMCEQMLGIEPATEEEKPKPRTSQGVDEVILLGSPGVDTQKATELGVGKDHVFVGAADNDPVTHLPTKSEAALGWMLGGPVGVRVGRDLFDVGHDDLYFGKDPASKAFGAQRFLVDDGPRMIRDGGGFDAHSQYFTPEKDQVSANNIAKIVAGHPESIVREKHR
nr:alpha/beta hydrolase [Streptomyces katrae]